MLTKENMEKIQQAIQAEGIVDFFLVGVQITGNEMALISIGAASKEVTGAASRERYHRLLGVVEQEKTKLVINCGLAYQGPAPAEGL